MIKPNLSYHPVLHLAVQQKEVPVRRSLTIENTSHANLENLSLKILVEPDFADPWEIPIDSIPAGARIEWSQIDMKWKPARLMDLTERMAAHLIIQVTKGEEVLFSHRYPLDI